MLLDGTLRNGPRMNEAGAVRTSKGPFGGKVQEAMYYTLTVGSYLQPSQVRRSVSSETDERAWTKITRHATPLGLDREAQSLSHLLRADPSVVPMGGQFCDCVGNASATLSEGAEESSGAITFTSLSDRYDHTKSEGGSIHILISEFRDFGAVVNHPLNVQERREARRTDSSLG